MVNAHPCTPNITYVVCVSILLVINGGLCSMSAFWFQQYLGERVTSKDRTRRQGTRKDSKWTEFRCDDDCLDLADGSAALPLMSSASAVLRISRDLDLSSGQCLQSRDRFWDRSLATLQLSDQINKHEYNCNNNNNKYSSLASFKVIILHFVFTFQFSCLWLCVGWLKIQNNNNNSNRKH